MVAEAVVVARPQAAAVVAAVIVAEVAVVAALDPPVEAVAEAVVTEVAKLKSFPSTAWWRKVHRAFFSTRGNEGKKHRKCYIISVIGTSAHSLRLHPRGRNYH
jgi:hypothetical protein